MDSKYLKLLDNESLDFDFDRPISFNLDFKHFQSDIQNSQNQYSLVLLSECFSCIEDLDEETVKYTDNLN